MFGKEKKQLSDAGLAKVSGGENEPRRQKIGYTVKRGDTLTKIAAMYGVSIMDLVTWNNIRNPLDLKAGQKLVIRF